MGYVMKNNKFTLGNQPRFKNLGILNEFFRKNIYSFFGNLIAIYILNYINYDKNDNFGCKISIV